MSFQVEVPDIGDFSDVPVVDVLVDVGDEVAKDDPLITLESDKSSMDVPSPEAGTVEEIQVSVGDELSEGDPICTLSGVDGSGDETEDDGGEGGEKSEARDGDEDGEPDQDAAGHSEGGDEGADEDADDGGGEASPTETLPSGEPIYASPAVRRLAREEGVDLSEVEGTGRKGRITKEDVREHEPGRDGAPQRDGAGAGIEGLELAPWPDDDPSEWGEVEVVELSRIKQISAPNLARNWVHIPHVTHHDEADITELEAFRKQVNSEQDEAKLTMVALLAKALVPVLREFPTFNASLAGDGKLALKKYVHMGFAADTPQGLLVPVIRDVDRKGLIEIAADLIELSGKAREGKLGPQAMKGASFTISSLGGIGGTGFTPIVNAPDVAILGVTRAVNKPVWNEEAGEFEPRLIVPLSLSYDHRVIDGAEAARFMVMLTEVLGDLKRVVL